MDAGTGVRGSRTAWGSPGRGSIAARVWCWILLLAAPLVVYHPIVFGGYSFSFGTHSIHPERTYEDSNFVPLLDPGAGSAQDEPWTWLIRDSLLRGELPLVNLWNGLGAPLLETLQPGVLYPLNLVLPLLPGDSAWLFDLFVLLHVELLLGGLFVLFGAYARSPIALVLALAVGLSGVSYQHANMVHFRSFAWLPWALVAAVRIARGSTRRRDAALFVVAHVCAVAAGALQEAFLGSLVLGGVFLAEWLLAPASAGAPRPRLVRFAAMAAGSTLLATPSFVPYLIARARGDLFTQATADRSVIALDGDAGFSLLLPHVHGVYPELLRVDRSIRWMTDYATTGAFLLILSAVAVLAWRSRQRALYVCIAAVAVAFALKVQHVAWLDFFGSIPFLSEILFTKYHLGLFVLIGVLSAIGLEDLASAPATHRRRAVLAGAALTTLCLAAMAWQVTHGESWRAWAELSSRARDELAGSHAASIAAFLLVALVLWLDVRHGLWIAAVLVVLGAERVVPSGWMQRLDTHWLPVDAEPLVGGEPRHRVLSMLTPNQNAMLGIESISVYDPVHLSSVHGVYPRGFELENPGFILHPIPRGAGLGARELDTARLLGVTRVHGWPLATDEGVPRTSETIHALRGTLPRVWLADRAELDRIEREATRRPFVEGLRDTLTSLRAAIARAPRVENLAIESRGLSFDVPRAFDGALVVAQAHASGWTLDGVAARPFLGILCRFDVQLDAPRRLEVSYWPAGLTYALPLAGLGLLASLLAAAFLFGRARPTEGA